MLVSIISLFLTVSLTEGQLLGLGGLPGQRTPRAGSVWPPYPGAGQGYWAKQAGYYPGYQQSLKQQNKPIPLQVKPNLNQVKPILPQENHILPEINPSLPQVKPIQPPTQTSLSQVPGVPSNPVVDITHNLLTSSSVTQSPPTSSPPIYRPPIYSPGIQTTPTYSPAPTYSPPTEDSIALRRQQLAMMMSQYLTGSNSVPQLTNTVDQPTLQSGQTQPTLYRFHTRDGSLTPVYSVP